MLTVAKLILRTGWGKFFTKEVFMLPLAALLQVVKALVRCPVTTHLPDATSYR